MGSERPREQADANLWIWMVRWESERRLFKSSGYWILDARYL